MDDAFLNTKLESLVRGTSFVGGAMRIWHKNFTAEELAALRIAVDWLEDAFEGDEPDVDIIMPDVRRPSDLEVCGGVQATSKSWAA
jgi:hypothetical protein